MGGWLKRPRLLLVGCGAILVAFVWDPFVGLKAASQNPVEIPACEAYEITSPTVIAFVDYINGRTEPNFNDALDDFQFYLGQLRKRLDQSVIRVDECYEQSFEIRTAGKQQLFSVPRERMGYYFVAPGIEPHVELGAMMDGDLIKVMEKYFGSEVVNKALRRRQ